MSGSEQEDPRLRFRVWVDGELVDETWLDATNPDADEHFAAMTGRHEALVQAADLIDSVWLVEWYDPARPEDQAYGRAGTDVAGMVDPKPL